jgi:hypothetical protein
MMLFPHSPGRCTKAKTSTSPICLCDQSEHQKEKHVANKMSELSMYEHGAEPLVWLETLPISQHPILKQPDLAETHPAEEHDICRNDSDGCERPVVDWAVGAVREQHGGVRRDSETKGPVLKIIRIASKG